MPAIRNIFCASNPARLSDALWAVLSRENPDFSNDIIFLPSRRAVRSVEKMIVEKIGGAVLLPKLVALGEGADDDDEDSATDGEVSNLERMVVLAKMLSAQTGGGIAGALPVAKDLVRTMDYLENEGASARIDWASLVKEEYAEHFQEKARFLDLACSVLPLVFKGRETITQRRNKDIRSWIEYLKKGLVGRVIVCGSTASVPATADLMEHIAGLENGYVILPGKISNPSSSIPLRQGCGGQVGNLCDPYYSELKLLERIGMSPKDVRIIDVGESNIDFFNAAFDNMPCALCPVPCATRIDCARESEEAEVVAEIAAEKSGQGKSVLIVSPDISAAQRLCESLKRRGAAFDFSGGTKGSATHLGRWILRILEKNEFKKTKDFFGSLLALLDVSAVDAASEESLEILDSLKNLADMLQSNGLELSPPDMRAVVAECLNAVSIRPPRAEDCPISIVGTIESRMQTADVIILTGLNEGMFPATGYGNPWLPRRIADALGLPPPERKVSLMALDFINLSCGPMVYWTRSKMSGGGETTESRFLSRVAVANVSGKDEKCAPSPPGPFRSDTYWLSRVRATDNVPFCPLDDSSPRPPAVNDDVYVTELELLIHNPYAFYARHILRLKPKDDPEREPDARDFGILVHEVIERIANGKEQPAINEIVEMFDRGAKKVLPAGSILFHFWRKRFLEIAPAVGALLRDIKVPEVEIPLECFIAGRRVKARADMVYDNVVLDVKTGAAPGRKQLEEGNMPQLPLEAYMRGAKIMQFLQLRDRDVRLIEYRGAEARAMIDAAVAKTTALFKQYGESGAPYEYRETGDEKYKAWDDLARR